MTLTASGSAILAAGFEIVAKDTTSPTTEPTYWPALLVPKNCVLRGSAMLFNTSIRSLAAMKSDRPAVTIWSYKGLLLGGEARYLNTALSTAVSMALGLACSIAVLAVSLSTSAITMANRMYS